MGLAEVRAVASSPGGSHLRREAMLEGAVFARCGQEPTPLKRVNGYATEALPRVATSFGVRFNALLSGIVNAYR